MPTPVSRSVICPLTLPVKVLTKNNGFEVRETATGTCLVIAGYPAAYTRTVFVPGETFARVKFPELSVTVEPPE
jgi:hypothetical protein